MKDKIPFVPLKEIATINQGLSIRSKIWKSSTREEIEDYIANGYEIIKERITSLEDFEIYSNINYFHTSESYLM